MNVLSNHHFDPKYFEKKQKNQEKEKKNKEGKSGKEDESDWQEDVPKDINFAQLEGMCYCCGKKVCQSPKCPEKDKPEKDGAVNRTREAAFIQTAMARGGDVQSVVSAPPAINQQEGLHSVGWHVALVFIKYKMK
jgi:hypothetical protein